MKKIKYAYFFTVMLIFSMLTACGVNQADYDVANERIAGKEEQIEELLLQLQYYETEKSTLRDELYNIHSELLSYQNKISDLGPNILLSVAEAEIALENLDRQAIIDNLYAKINDLENELDKESTRIQSLIDDLDTELADRQAVLDDLEVRIRETGEAPISLGAGFYSSPGDIPPGRYRVTGSSNFFVRGSDGWSRVNIILGGGTWGLDYFVFNLNAGDEVEALSAFVLTPVE